MIAPLRGTIDDDARLLRDAAAGDWESIGMLYDRHRDGALAVAISVLADPAEAEDVVQDVFIDLPRMARTFDPERGRTEQWLCRSVRNRAIDHVRRRSRRLSRVAPTMDGTESLLALVPARTASPVEMAEAAEFLDLLGHLEPRQAHLIRLAFVEGWSHSAIARLTGIPLGTVKTRLRKGVRQVGEMLSDPALHARVPDSHRAPARGLIVVSDDPAFRSGVSLGAAGIARVELTAWTTAREESTRGGSAQPSAIVLDVAAAETPVGEAIDQLTRHHWDAVPLLVRAGIDGATDVPRRRGFTLVVGHRDAPILATADAMRVVLTASGDSRIRSRAMARLMRSGGAFLAGDRLGRLRSVTPAAARLIGRSRRELEGEFVTGLGAAPVADAERKWQELAAHGEWSGTSLVRRTGGPPVAIAARAWMTPSGFVSALGPADQATEWVA